jgi:hypothetical protein
MSRTTPRVTPHADDPVNAVIEWVRPDQTVEFTFHTCAIVNDDIRRWLLFYGVKQVLADGGAVGRDVPAAERLAKMEKRARALIDGTWSFRDGYATGRTNRTSDSAMMFAALVAVGIVPDIPEARESWKALTPTQRRAAFDAAGDGAKAHYDAATAAARVTPIDGAALLAKMTGNR